MSDEEKEQTVHEEDEGTILIYPVWTKKNAPSDKQSKWEVPIYL